VSPSNLVRWGAAGFVLSGVVWLVAGFIAAFLMRSPVTGIVYYYVALGIVARLLLGLGIVGLYILQKERYGSLGRAGFYTILVALAAQILGALASLAGIQALAWLISPVGLLVLIVGFVLLGVASLTSEGVATLVQHLAHHLRTRFCGPGVCAVRGTIVGCALASTGLRAVAAR
jgi:hypothetical protein